MGHSRIFPQRFGVYYYNKENEQHGYVSFVGGVFAPLKSEFGGSSTLGIVVFYGQGQNAFARGVLPRVMKKNKEFIWIFSTLVIPVSACAGKRV